MSPADTARPVRARRRAGIALGAVLLAALLLRFAGLDWPAGLHPDEGKIVSWLAVTRVHTRIEEAAYPCGYFTLMRPVQRLARAAAMQRGRWARFTGAREALPAPAVDLLRLARRANAWLGALTCLLVYRLARGLRLGRGAAVLAAALAACAPQAVEHAHYAETDVAAVAVLTLALVLWCAAARRDTVARCAAAGLATGFALGTKYTLLPLLALAAAFVARPGGGPPRRRAGRAALLLLAVCGGFAWAHPGVLRPAWFLEATRAYGAHVAAEGREWLGAAGSSWYAAAWARGLAAARFARPLGGAWLAAAAAGLGLLAWRPAARGARLLPLFATAFLAYAALLSPWVRAQEVMPLVPVFAVAAAAAVARVARGGGRVRRAAAYGLAAAALLPAAAGAVYVAAAFIAQEPRTAAGRWLARHAPDDGAAGYEGRLYLGRVFADTRMPTLETGKVEAAPPGAIDPTSLCCVLRDASTEVRGLRDPRTGRRRPGYAAGWSRFTSSWSRVAAWGPAPGPRPTFAARGVELYTPRAHGPRTVLELPLPRPARLTDGRERELLPWPPPPVGAETVLLVDRRPKALALAAPDGGAVDGFAVLVTGERPARIVLRAGAVRRRSVLAAFDLAALPFGPASPHPFRLPYGRLAARAEPRPHEEYLPCYLHPVADAAAAAAWCLAWGHDAEAEARLAAPATDGAAALCAVAAGARAADLPGATRARARRFLERLDEALDRPERVDWNGVPMGTLDDFARLRLDVSRAVAVRVARAPSATADRPIDGVWPVPCVLPPGAWDLALDLAAAGEEGERPPLLPVDLLDADGAVLAALRPEPGAHRTAVRFRFENRAAVRPHWRFAGAPQWIEIRAATVRWRPAGQLERFRDRLRAALGRAAGDAD